LPHSISGKIRVIKTHSLKKILNFKPIGLQNIENVV